MQGLVRFGLMCIYHMKSMSIDMADMAAASYGPAIAASRFRSLT